MPRLARLIDIESQFCEPDGTFALIFLEINRHLLCNETGYHIRGLWLFQSNLRLVLFLVCIFHQRTIQGLYFGKLLTLSLVLIKHFV